MIFVFYFFAVVLILLSLKSFRGGIAWLRFFQDAISRPEPRSGVFVTLFVPCRGLDEGLIDNLTALAAQDYQGYEIIFIVDASDDPAAEVIAQVRSRSTVSSAMVVAQKATGSSQKVANLLEAVRHASAASEVYAFADSDICPGSEWLRHLVAPLADARVGAATGYRWFISKRPTFASEMRSAWNASIASALGPNRRSNFCWGGSMAMRREVFDRLDMRQRWQGALSDDLAVTRAMGEAGLEIAFVPQALVASVENCSFGEMLEFTTRQMKITRVYAPRLWLMSLFGSAVFNGILIMALLILILGTESGVPTWVALLTILLVTVFSTGKSWLRLRAVRLVLTGYSRDLQRQTVIQNTFFALTPAIFLYNSLAALFSRRITWRGTTYELKSPDETVIIAD